MTELERLHNERRKRQDAMGFALEMRDGKAVSALMKDCSTLEKQIALIAKITK